MLTIGRLSSVPVSAAPDQVGAPVLDALRAAGLADAVGVVDVDPELSDTALTQDAYALPAESLANCVLVAGKRAGEERVAACVVLATHRADVNTVVKRALDVRKASFLAREDAVERSGMEFGGITAFGLPQDWRVLVDAAVVEQDVLVMGSGLRRSKLLLPGTLLRDAPGVEVVTGLGA